MIVFDLLEVLLIVIFVALFTSLKHKFSYILLTSCLSFLLMEGLQFLGIYDHLLVVLEIGVYCLVYYAFEKRLSFSVLISSILGPWLSGLSTSLVIALSVFIYQRTIDVVLSFHLYHILLGSRIVCLLFMIAIIYFKQLIDINALEEQKILLFMIMIVVFSIYYIILNDIGMQRTMTNLEMLVILILMNILIVLIIIFFIQYTRLKERSYHYQFRIQQLQYLDKSKDMIQRTQENIKKLQHGMRYMLLKVKRDIIHQDYQHALEDVDKFYGQLEKYSHIIHTGNYQFDESFNNYIFYLKTLFQVDIHLMIMISQNHYYNSKEFISIIMNCLSALEQYSIREDLMIQLSEDHHFIRLQMILSCRYHHITNNIFSFLDYQNIHYTIRYEHNLMNFIFIIDKSEIFYEKQTHQKNELYQ